MNTLRSRYNCFGTMSDCIQTKRNIWKFYSSNGAKIQPWQNTVLVNLIYSAMKLLFTKMKLVSIFQGAPGVQGPQGPQGNRGHEGPEGLIGPKGMKGTAGAGGPQGPKGDRVRPLV